MIGQYLIQARGLRESQMSIYRDNIWQKTNTYSQSDTYKLKIAGEQSVDIGMLARMKHSEREEKIRRLKEDLMVKLGQQIQ